MWLIYAFLLGLQDATEQHGELSVGRSSIHSEWNNAYDRGANVGEWMHDLNWFHNVMRWPWHQRIDAPAH